MRYVITKDQFHSIVYNILDDLSEGGKVEKVDNPYWKESYRVNLYDKNGENFIRILTSKICIVLYIDRC